MTSSGRRSLVLRGVGVHAAPVRLQGVRAVSTSGDAQNLAVQREPAVQPAASAMPSPTPDMAQALEAQHRQARQLGHEEGWREGLAAARQKMEAEAAEQRMRHEKALEVALAKLQREQAQNAAELARRFEAVRSELGRQLAAQVKALEQQAVGLAFQSLRRVLGSRVHRIDAMQALIERQVGELQRMGALRIHLNPDDLAAFDQAEGRALPTGDTVRIVPDAHLPPGGCTVHSDRGFVDVGLSTQLERLGQAWLDQFVEEGGGREGTPPAQGPGVSP